MRKTQQVATLALVGVAAFAAIVGVGCNSATDDPETAGAIVEVATFEPNEACIDYDGELEDVDGDGTDETVFTSTENNIVFDSRARTPNSSGQWNDLIFTTIDVVYDDISGGTGRPLNRIGEAFQVTVPAGGTATTGLTTILASDVASGLFDSTSRGNIYFRFYGRDAGGEPYETDAELPIRSVTICGGL